MGRQMIRTWSQGIRRRRARGEQGMQGGRAFTLVELMVVIGISAVVMALVLPALRRARASALTVTCLSQLRQIGMAIHQYASANGGRLPVYSGRHEYPIDVQRPGDINWFGPG